MDYIRGLLGLVERKDTWQIAEYAGHASPYRLQNLLGRTVWDPDRVRNEVREYVFASLPALPPRERGSRRNGRQSI